VDRVEKAGELDEIRKEGKGHEALGKRIIEHGARVEGGVGPK